MININTCFLKSKKQITLKRELTHTKSAKMVGDASENKFYINFGAHKEKKNDCQREKRKKNEWNDSQKICMQQTEKEVYRYIFSLLSNDYWLYTSYFQKKKKREER